MDQWTTLVVPASFDGEAKRLDAEAPDAGDRPRDQLELAAGVQFIHLHRVHLHAEQTDADVSQPFVAFSLHHEPSCAHTQPFVTLTH